MSNKKTEIPIFFAVDDGYIPFLAVTLEGIKKHATGNYIYKIIVLYNNISKTNINRINKYNSDSIKIDFLNVTNHMEKISEELYTRDYYSKSTYFRLFIPDLFPEYDKAIYLDSDIAVLTDVAQFYNIDIGDNLLGATPDGVIQAYDVFKIYAEKVVGVNSYKNYFNAGILLMNLKELRKMDFQDKFVYLLGTMKFRVAQDQDYLNRICKGRVKIISDSWDKMPIKELYDPNQELNIIHYNLTSKPWHYDGILFEEYFWELAKNTEYYDYILKIKEEYTDEERQNDKECWENLQVLAKKESDCVGLDNPNGFKKS